jgi:hypothetical protein
MGWLWGRSKAPAGAPGDAGAAPADTGSAAPLLLHDAAAGAAADAAGSSSGGGDAGSFSSGSSGASSAPDAAADGGDAGGAGGGALDAAAAAAAAAAAEGAGADMPYVHTHLTERFRGKFQRLDFPTFEQMMAEDAMNNCAVRSAIACVGGAALGAAFGIFMGSVDTGVRSRGQEGGEGGSEGGSEGAGVCSRARRQRNPWPAAAALDRPLCAPAAAARRPRAGHRLTGARGEQADARGAAGDADADADEERVRRRRRGQRRAAEGGTAAESLGREGVQLVAPKGAPPASQALPRLLRSAFSHPARPHPAPAPARAPSSYAKGFAVMGLVYSGCECLIEKHRARHDIWNAPLAGCAAGAIMAAPSARAGRGATRRRRHSGSPWKGLFERRRRLGTPRRLTRLAPATLPAAPTRPLAAGPKGMCFGCASFAAFSYAIEKFMGI